MPIFFIVLISTCSIKLCIIVYKPLLWITFLYISVNLLIIIPIPYSIIFSYIFHILLRFNFFLCFLLIFLILVIFCFWLIFLYFLFTFRFTLLNYFMYIFSIQNSQLTPTRWRLYSMMLSLFLLSLII